MEGLNKLKRIVGLLVAAVLTMALFPAQIQAVSDESLPVQLQNDENAELTPLEVTVQTEEETSITQSESYQALAATQLNIGDGQVLYINDGGAYELNGVTGYVDESTLIYGKAGASYTVVLQNSEPVHVARVHSEMNLTIAGSGTLYAKHSNMPAIRANQLLKIEDGVNAYAENSSSASGAVYANELFLEGNLTAMNTYSAVSPNISAGVRVVNQLHVGRQASLNGEGRDFGIYVYNQSNNSPSGSATVYGRIEGIGGKSGLYVYRELIVDGGYAAGTATENPTSVELGKGIVGIRINAIGGVLQLLNGATVYAHSNGIGTQADQIWADASNLKSAGGQYGIKNTWRQSTQNRLAVELTNGTVFDTSGERSGFLVEAAQGSSPSKVISVGSKSSLLAEGGERGIDMHYADLYVVGEQSKVVAKGSATGIYMQAGKIKASSGALLQGEGTEEAANGIYSDFSITADGATIRGIAPAYGAGFGGIASSAERTTTNRLSATNGGAVEEEYQSIEEFGKEFGIPFYGLGTIKSYANYQSWQSSFPDSIEVDKNTQQGVRALDYVSEPTQLRVTRTGAAENEVVILDENSTHSVTMRVVLLGPQTYRLSFHLRSEAATGQPIDQFVKEGWMVKPVEQPVLEGYEFLGWENAADGSRIDFEHFTMPSFDVELNAVWKKIVIEGTPPPSETTSPQETAPPSNITPPQETTAPLDETPPIATAQPTETVPEHSGERTEQVLVLEEERKTPPSIPAANSENSEGERAAAEVVQTENLIAEAEQRSEVKEKMVREEETPLAQTVEKEQTWALLNLMLAVVAALMGLMAVLGRNRQNHNNMNNSSGLFRFFALLLAVASVAVFMVTEDMGSKIAFFDEWTTLMVVFVAIQTVLLTIEKKLKNKSAA